MSSQPAEAFVPSETQIRCAQALLVAMAHEATLRPIVEGYERAILAKHQFKRAAMWSKRAGQEGEVITEGKHAFLLDEADLKVYLAECQAAQDAHGLKTEKPGNCPLLEAQHVRTQCEIALLQAWEGHPRLSVLADTRTLCGERRHQVIELTLGLLAPHLKDNARDMLADLGMDPPEPYKPHAPAARDVAQPCADSGRSDRSGSEDEAEGLRP